MASATKEIKEAPGRIWLIPHYFGGDGATGDAAWDAALGALTHLAKGDPVLRLIVKQVDDAWADCVESALRYGRELGPDAQDNVGQLSDDEYEVRMGKARVKS
jgi:hypothetical protein